MPRTEGGGAASYSGPSQPSQNVPVQASVRPSLMPGGDRAATPAERSAAYRARRKATAAAAPAKPPVVVEYRRPADRRSRPQQWADAVQTLADLLDRFQEWRDNLPSSLANSATAEALEAVLELRGYIEELQAAELPKGFGGD